MTDEIIDCGGKYEVHPMADGGYGVVNSESGDVRCSFASKAEAMKEATSLNEVTSDERVGWWKIAAWNQESQYGYGSQSQAEAFCDQLNSGREINLYSAEFVGETDEEAREATGHQHLGDGDGFDFE